MKASIYAVEPLPRCSSPASISTITYSFLSIKTYERRFFKRTFSAQKHPPPPLKIFPSITSLVLSFLSEYISGISSTLGFNLKKEPYSPFLAPVLSSINSCIWASGLIFFNSSPVKPIALARLESGSASIARTLLPLSLKTLAITPASVVFPVPPFPDIAIFILAPPFSSPSIK
ncbi:MAG: hypothetical protein BWX58_00543 [Deltaproteobacteria bacterium ADurb.Bin026]|nr:MAG: hypothetical protein BWX58_00543 [Deltaproteobacteria bacterium ADurb.Bin026]